MKTKLFALLALSVVAALAIGGSVTADDNEEKEFKATCPVSGQPAIEDSSLEHKGKTVYFCCKNCPKAFEADPAKFAAKTRVQLLETGQMIQVACPFTGEAINPEAGVEVGNAKVFFCCNNCKGKYNKASADEKLALVFDDISKGFTLQTECPVSGKPIDVTKTVEHEGKTVYFCCANCPKAFEADPAKFIEKLPQFAEEE